MNRLDILATAALLALSLVCVAILSARSAPVPDLFGYTIAALTGYFTGQAFPARRRPAAL